MTVARVTLRISDEQFWELTPLEYRAACDEYEDGQRRIDLRFGQLLALVANAVPMEQGNGTKGGFTPAHFFASLKAPAKAPPAPDGRPAEVVLEDTIAEGWMAFARKANEVAAAKGLPSQQF